MRRRNVPVALQRRGELSEWRIGCCFEKLAECPNCSFRLCPDCDDLPGCFHCGARMPGRCARGICGVLRAWLFEWLWHRKPSDA